MISFSSMKLCWGFSAAAVALQTTETAEIVCGVTATSTLLVVAAAAGWPVLGTNKLLHELCSLSLYLMFSHCHAAALLLCVFGVCSCVSG